ncbi:diguanylate cyclase regulator RdcB family protein [Enterobacter hormaechei]
MTTQLLDGPGRHWSVFIQNLWSIWSRADAARHALLGPQQLQFRERLTQEIITQTRLRPWAMAGMLNKMQHCGWVWRRTCRYARPGHLALTRMSDRLVALRQQVNPRLPQPPGLLQQ